MGADGRGTGEHLGAQAGIDLYFGTFAKTFAAIGGVTAAESDVVEWIRYNARTNVFAKALPLVYVQDRGKGPHHHRVRAAAPGADVEHRAATPGRARRSGFRHRGHRIPHHPCLRDRRR